MIDPMNSLDSEQGFILSLILLATSMFLPVLQEVALICTILVALGTLFVNRRKYAAEFRTTAIYKRFKKKDDEKMD